ncbi:breast cancer type 2 susceptibility protein homolog [Centruroides sculpturatus]|uniref:breast cancer type 2 susceptibility protein homolog n=1 Tax=Centruroides sculpturatus TaxID=218467 RepID=UPI000C6EA2F2|nr:breast cancer type 2 susceptibility protein homolog [Centruroides sculpturatus]
MRMIGHITIDQAWPTYGPQARSGPSNEFMWPEINLSILAACILTVWSPSEKSLQMLTEGKLLRIFNLIPGTKRNWKRQIQLNSTKLTDYEEIKNSSDIIKSLYIPRKVTKFSEINSKSDFQEFDVVGIVVSVVSNENSLQQIVYLGDDEFCFLAIKFPKGVDAFGLEDMLLPGQFVAASNLSNICKDGHQISTAMATELSLFSTCPRSPIMKEAMHHLKTSIQDVNNFVKQAQDQLANFQLNQLFSPVIAPPANISPFMKFQKDISPLINIKKSNIPIKRKLYPVYSPLCLKTPIYSPPLKKSKDDTDNSSAIVETKYSPEDLKSSEIKARISILSKYGSAPPLPPLTSPSSAKTKMPFCPPIKKDATPLGSKNRGIRQWRGKTLPSQHISKEQKSS